MTDGNPLIIMEEKGGMTVGLQAYFPVFEKLSPQDQEQMLRTAVKRTVPKGTVLYNGSGDCIGLLVIRSGQLRAYINSDEGREVTLYRLFAHDICLFSASCMMNSIQFDLTISAEKETEFWIISPCFYKTLMERSAPVANYTNELMATRMTDIMWLMEQILWKSMDKRLAQFLLEESSLEESTCLRITHEAIANHLGTAREVITRMLKYFQTEGMVKLTRGAIELLDEEKLQKAGG